MDLLQWPGAVLGLIGALLVAQASVNQRRAGFIIWIISNTLLIGWAIYAQAWALVGMYVLYGLTSIMGALNCRPAKQTCPGG